MAGADRRIRANAKTMALSLAAVPFSLYGYCFQRAWNSSATALVIPVYGSGYPITSCIVRALAALALIVAALLLSARSLRIAALAGGLVCQLACVGALFAIGRGLITWQGAEYLPVILESIGTMISGAVWLDLYSTLSPLRAASLLAVVFLLGWIIGFSIEESSPERLCLLLVTLAFTAWLCAFVAIQKYADAFEGRQKASKRLFPYRAACFIAACSLAYGIASSLHPTPSSLRAPVLPSAFVLLVVLVSRKRFNLSLFIWISAPFLLCGLLMSMLLPGFSPRVSSILLNEGYGAVRLLLFLLVCAIAHSSASGTYWLFGVLTFLQMLFQACGIYLGMSLAVGSTRAIIAGIFVILLVVLATIATMTHEGAYSLIEVRFPGLSQEGKSDPDEHGGDKAPFSTLDSNESLAVRIDGLVSAYGLTNREAEVLTAAARGESNEKIANGMFVSIGTVKAHLYHIYKKMNIHTRKELYKALGISKKDR